MTLSPFKLCVLSAGLAAGGCAQLASPDSSASAAPDSSPSAISVVTQVWISKANSDREVYEMIGAIDPADSNHLLSCTTNLSTKTNARTNII